ncbi:hypothetical protein [Edaphovirga cremea]|uniref:hypothetical protein n=1 Tax=Edaphovirga cremea TaxID=2267246 RepID=UPI003989EBA7
MKLDYQKLIGLINEAVIALKQTGLNVSLAADLERMNQQLQQSPIVDVITERQRQVSDEGYTSGHDDIHENGELALAAAEYAIQAAVAPWDEDIEYDEHEPGKYWPWDVTCWKPTSQRRDLVKAGALILAEIERIDRAATFKPGENNLAGVIE